MRKFYVRHIRPHIASPLHQQRLKLLWFAWGYYPLVFHPVLLFKFLRIDWHVEHGHRPAEMAAIWRAFRNCPDGIMVEAGCFNGGSTAKFSILCQRSGRELFVYDSFEGVEPMSEDAKRDSYDFSGEYAATEETVRANVARYGEISVCRFFKGWFADTLANGVGAPIALAYIDCDVAKGTNEALRGVLPALVKNGRVFSQDFHIKPVREMLESRSDLCVRYLTGNLAVVTPS